MTPCQLCEAATNGFICRGCCIQVERAIGDMLSLLAELTTTETRQDRAYRRPRPRAAEPVPADRPSHLAPMLRSTHEASALRGFAMPANLDAAALRDETWNELATTARVLAERAKTQAPADCDLIGWLLENVESFRWHEAGGQLARSVLHVHGRLERAVDRSPSRVYAGPCETEGCVEVLTDGTEAPRSLWAPWGPPDPDDSGDDRGRKQFDCDACGASYTWHERQEWLLSVLDGQLVSLDDLKANARLLGVVWPPAATVRSWLFRGRISVRHVDRGVELFDATEVLDLVRDEGQRSGPKAQRAGRRAS